MHDPSQDFTVLLSHKSLSSFYGLISNRHKDNSLFLFPKISQERKKKGKESINSLILLILLTENTLKFLSTYKYPSAKNSRNITANCHSSK